MAECAQVVCRATELIKVQGDNVIDLPWANVIKYPIWRSTIATNSASTTSIPIAVQRSLDWCATHHKRDISRQYRQFPTQNARVMCDGACLP